jgi:hypothetical protein
MMHACPCFVAFRASFVECTRATMPHAHVSSVRDDATWPGFGGIVQCSILPGFSICDRLPSMVGPIAMRSFVRARVVVLACVARADEPTPSTSTATSGETDDERFRRLKADGDRALAERRLNDAIKAYDAAVKIRRDPLTAGRLGLAISYFDDPRAHVHAANFLYEAVADTAGVSSQEKDAFFAAYKRMRKLVCKLLVATNDTNAKIDLGDGFKHQLPAFFKFVKKGKGAAIAKLDGREDIHKSWDCAGDHDIEIKFEFPPAEAAPAKTITITEKGKETVTIVRVPISVENPIVDSISNRNRISVWFGPNIVFGVAPSPAYGLTISGAYNFAKWSMMLGARGAYAFGSVVGNRLDVFTVTGLAGPCTRAQWFYVCGFAALNAIKPIPNYPVPPDFDTITQIAPGLGIAIGARYSFTRAVALFAAGDAMVLSSPVAYEFRGSNGPHTRWTGGQFLGSLSLGLAFGP